MVNKLFAASLVSVALFAIPAAAQESAALHHAPPTRATAHLPMTIAATIDNPQTIKRAVLLYWVGPNKTMKEVPFLRSADGYAAEVPADDVVSPNVAYAIELENADGSRVPVYATRNDPHVVDVPADLDDQRETALDAQLHGRRSVFTATSEYVSFGKSKQQDASISDYYYRIEGSFTYRPLRTILEFGIRAGAVRGKAPIADPGGRDPGLNYGAPFVVFRFHDLVHVEASLLTSVTEQGFSSGLGAAFHIGDPYGTKLILGFETVKTFGTRGYSRLDLVRGWVRVSPIVEVTDAPHADRAGVRLLTELAFMMKGGWTVAVRGGYAARDFYSGGPGLGASLAYAF